MNEITWNISPVICQLLHMQFFYEFGIINLVKLKLHYILFITRGILILKTYLDIYNENIAPILKEIDIFIRSDEAITMDHVTELLQISKNEIYSILSEQQLFALNKMNFFVIMRDGSSQICSLFRRELERNNPTYYSIDDISYIYDIPYELVHNAYITSSMDRITSQNIKELFSNISAAEVCNV